MLHLGLFARLLRFGLFFILKFGLLLRFLLADPPFWPFSVFETTFGAAEAWAALACCRLGLLAKLLKFALLLAAEAWATSTVSFCGSALRADFFF